MRQTEIPTHGFVTSRKAVLPLLGCLLLLAISAMVQGQDVRDSFLKSGQKTIPSIATDELLREPSFTREVARAPEVGSKSRGAQHLLDGNSPLRATEKLSYGLRNAFVSPEAFVRPAFSAYLRERKTVRAPEKDGNDRLADGFSSYARAFANRSTAQLFGSGIYPALFKQDPRYRPSNKDGALARTLYAASRVVLTQGDNGKTQINYSKLAGNMTSAALANLYERDRVTARDLQGRVLDVDRQIGVGPTFRRFGILMVTGLAGRIIFDEFDLDGRAGRALRGLFGGR